MRTLLTIAIVSALSLPIATQAADKNKSQSLIDSSRAVVADFKSKNESNQLVAGDITAAERHIEKAAGALKAGEKLLGFGGISDEAEQEVRHETALVDLTLKLATSKLERSKTEAESAVLSKKIAAVQAKVKIFDDFRAEIARLKADAAANEKAGKELEKLKGEKGALEGQLGKLSKEKAELEGVKAENQRLTAQLEKLQAEQKKSLALPVAVPVKVESAAPAKTLEVLQERTVPAPMEEKLPAKAVLPEPSPVSDQPVKNDGIAAPVIVPAQEK